MTPIKTTNFKLAEHSYRRHTCSIDPATISKDIDLEDGALYQNVAAKINDGDEIRIIADDYSFVAYLFVTFVRGTDVRAKLISFHELDAVYEDTDPVSERYEVKQRGVKKWCIVDKTDGSVIKELIPTQQEALRERDEYVRALKR